MSKAKHTPGPWQMDEGNEVHKHGTTIFAWPTWAGTPDEEQVANMRLGQEAPAMYEALCKIESVIDGVMDRALKSGLMGASEWDKICSDVGREEWDLFELQRQVRDILARIEGEGE